MEGIKYTQLLMRTFSWPLWGAALRRKILSRRFSTLFTKYGDDRWWLPIHFKRGANWTRNFTLPKADMGLMMENFDIVCRVCGQTDLLSKYDTISPITFHKDVIIDDPADYVPPDTVVVVCICGNSERLALNTFEGT